MPNRNSYLPVRYWRIEIITFSFQKFQQSHIDLLRFECLSHNSNQANILISPNYQLA